MYSRRLLDIRHAPRQNMLGSATLPVREMHIPTKHPLDKALLLPVFAIALGPPNPNSGCLIVPSFLS